MTTPRMQRRFNWSATTAAAELVLEGDCEDDKLDTISQLMLDNFTRVTDSDLLPKYITKDEFCGKIKVWQENVSTSPSERHLGTYKTLFQPINSRLDESTIVNLQHKQNAISRVHVQMLYSTIK